MGFCTTVAEMELMGIGMQLPTVITSTCEQLKGHPS